jgi:hypothetical protein
MTNILKPANKLILSALLCSAVAGQVVCAEDQPITPGMPKSTQGTEQSNWQKFDFDFAGGSPRDLVSDIEKATGKPLNVIISKEDETVEISALKFKGITVPDLFRALAMASQSQQQVGGTFYTFETQGQGENTIFILRSRKPSPPQKFCRFYQLADALQNYSIDDITTAIQTGWKMLGVKSPPELKFHPETKLLIAVGQPEHLAIIDDVLNGLRSATVPPAWSPHPSAPLQKKDAAPDKK